jgi:stage II sporulation protein D
VGNLPLMRLTRSAAQTLKPAVIRAFAVIAVTSATAASCGPPPATHVRVPVARARAIPRTVRVQVRNGRSTAVRDVPLEDYVAATVIAEVDPPSEDEAVLERMFEVQAIISRTYAVSHHARHNGQGFDFCATTHCQLYDPSRLRTSKWARLVRAAVDRTRGQMLWFGSAPAEATFHADCGGHTSRAADVWGGVDRAYLASAADDGPAAGAHSEWTLDVDVTALAAALNSDPRTAIGTRLDRISVGERDTGGRAERITVQGSAQRLSLRGETFREVVTRALGPKSLRSTLFTIRTTPEGIRFSGRGFGHGVGLCQAGALARLRAGASPAAVLSFYFPGTSVRAFR